MIIHRDNLHRVNNYKRVRIRPTNNATSITKYRAAPIVDNRIIRNYTKNERPRRKTLRRVQVASQRDIKNKNIQRPKGRVIKPLPAIGGIKKRYDYKDVNPAPKPRRIVTKRIHHRKLEAKRSSGVSAKTVREITKKVGHGNLVKGARIGKLKFRSRLVPADKVGRPVPEIKFREGELRRAEVRRAHPKVRAIDRTL